ncbi:transcriptional regulator with XRE-family HTH domain [Saccharothrix ecbatanensis]|uniref:Transcriptional regulator with XRE-family HTH domain n=1 Tax=Saccharothrix ecbatanensis TaxID=1105145 RepID=A0A7W9HRQ2_9PSEU|nr:helix-turn-helix transcriptional regulator [Saccharothrix ecbatanensis]MBB5806724.1 transcriptional regulator with XRE-family HTH domain [Saccharothrix ecbatanensis]
MTAPRGSTLRRRRLGHELRRLREEANRTHTDISKVLDCTQGRISKIEAGFLAIRPMEVKVVLDYLDVPQYEREPLIMLAKEAREQGLWTKHSNVMTSRFITYANLEAEATRICTYEAEVVPGLMQTEAYANAVNLATRPRDDIDAERYTEVRLARQERVLSGELDLWVVLNESAIRRVVGGEQVMREQLQHLLELAHQPSVTLQVLPFSAGQHPAMSGPFVITRFADRRRDPDVIYLENQTGGLYMEEPAEIERYNVTFDRLIADALDVGRSAKLIGRVIDELSGETIPY